MITGSLYPTQYTFPCGFNSTDEYNQEISSPVSNNNYSDRMAGYYLGWARPQNLPDAWKFTRPHAVTYAFSDADYGRLEDYRDLPRLSLNPIGNAEQNSDIGYGISQPYSYTGSFWTSYSSENTTGNKETGEYDDFGSNSNAVNNLSSTFGINNIYPEFWGITTVTLRFIIFFSNPLNEPLEIKNDFTISNITIPQYRLFKDGGLSYTYNGAYGKVTVTGTDFQEGKANVETSISNKAIVIFTGVTWGGSYTYRGSPNQVTWTPGIIIHDKTVFNFFGSAINTGDERFVVYNSAGYETSAPYYLNNLASYGVNYNGNGYTVGCGKELDLTIGDIIDIPNDHWTERFDGFILSRGSGGVAGGVWIYPYYDISMVDKVLGFLPKVMQNNSIPSYANINYAPLVTAGNEFTGRLHTGSTSDPGFVAKLREWQYIDPVESNPQNNGTKNTNEYDLDDPDDKPEYDPDPPTPEGDIGVNPDNPEINIAGADDTPEENDYSPIVGRPLPFAASEFTTTYVLSESEVKEVGRYLWATMATDPDLVLGNFIHSYDDTGTFNLARMYDMIISLRYFPFDIPFDYILRADGLTMGTGHSKIINRSVAITKVLSMTVDCGTCNIPIIFNKLSPDLEHGDFRNFVNTTITVYLPFCGTVELNPSDVIGYRISLKYSIDLMSGGCTACIYLHRKGAEFMIANKSGNIGILMPITATNAGQVSGTMLSDAANMVATVGSTIMNIVAAKGQMGDISTARSSPDISADRSAQLATQERNVKTGLGKQAFGAVSTSMHGLGNLLSRSGCAYSAMGGGYGAASYTMTVNPFVTIRVSNYASPNNYGHSTGYNSTDYKAIGEFKGFSVFVNPDLTGVEGTSAELGELKAILEHGIFIKK
jgi:hypothetical protein